MEQGEEQDSKAEWKRKAEMYIRASVAAALGHPNIAIPAELGGAAP